MEINIRYDIEASIYVSHCPELNIFSQGRTYDEAREALKDAIILYVKYI